MIIKTVADYKTPYIRMIVYGQPGVGKTRFGSSLPKPCLIDFDKGFLSARDLLPPEYKIYVPETWEDILTLISELRTNREGYESVVIDSFSLAERMIMAHVLKLSRKDHPTIGDWGMANEKSKRLIEWLCALNLHICLNCLELTSKNDLTGNITCAPLLPGKLSLEAPAFVDEVFHMRSDYDYTKKERKSKFLTSPDGIYIAKDRSGALDLLEVPDWNTIYGKIIGTNNK